ncbi:MAG: DUF3362 domain-containing protein [Firmicutes bacterium]|nr:DUF3362 domain-containing protein [Bacillota bacterium]
MFLPISKTELNEMGISQLDFIMVTGDAYVDHPSFGHALIARLVESFGYSVGIISQPQNEKDYRELGEPKHAFLISSGVVDSMVNNYTVALNKRTKDEYSDNGIYGKRPDRALTVYSKNLRKYFPDIFQIAGGVEASLRRFAHYDYWSNSVMPSILATAEIDLLIYGMGESVLFEMFRLLDKGVPLSKMKDLKGTAYLSTKENMHIDAQNAISGPTNKFMPISSYEKVKSDKLLYAKAFMQSQNHEKGIIQKQGCRYSRPSDNLSNSSCQGDGGIDNLVGAAFCRPLLNAEQNNGCAKAASTSTTSKHQNKSDNNFSFLIPHSSLNSDNQPPTADHYVICNPIPEPITSTQMDLVYSLPFTKRGHPKYNHIPALDEVSFSITSHRGCFGNCSFCALTFHQGKQIISRSEDSIISEIESLTTRPDFKGYIHDIGGPSANFYKSGCKKGHGERGAGNDDCQINLPSTKHQSPITNHQSCKSECIGTRICKNLNTSHSDYLNILRRARKIKGIKKVFIRSGIRFDHLLADTDETFFNELVLHHTSGQLKVAPEHVSDNVLQVMNKPSHETYKRFAKKFKALNAFHDKNQFLVPYFMSSHPGCTLQDAVKMLEYLLEINYHPEQVQDFYPTPGTLSTTMFHTELNPKTLKKIFVAKSKEEKAMQRALLQYRNPKNKELIKYALKITKRDDLLKKI